MLTAAALGVLLTAGLLTTAHYGRTAPDVSARIGTPPLPGGAVGSSGSGRASHDRIRAGNGPPTLDRPGVSVTTLALVATPPPRGQAAATSSGMTTAADGTGKGASVGSMSAMRAGARRAGASLVRVQAQHGGLRFGGYGVETGDADTVLTADSVVDGSDSIYVVDSSNNHMMATLVGTDPVTDIAVLRVDASSWAPLTMTSTPGRPGQALGALTGPAESGPGASADQLWIGDVQSTDVNADVPGRPPILASTALDISLPVDAVGAPVLDQAGHLTAIVAAPGGGHSTLAIPVTTAAPAMQSLLATGTVPHGWIGVDRAGTAADGVLVEQVDPVGPAARDSVAVGDVIVAVDGGRVSAPDDLWAAVRLRRPGSRLSLELQRSTSTWTINLVLGSMDDQ